jgi:hypothetical protein
VSSSPGLGIQRVSAIALGAIGLAGLATGAAFGAIAIGRKDDAARICPSLCPNQDGVDRWNAAVGAGNLSTASFVAGGAAAAIGAALWLTAPSRSLPAMRVGVAGTTARVEMSW